MSRSIPGRPRRHCCSATRRLSLLPAYVLAPAEVGPVCSVVLPIRTLARPNCFRTPWTVSLASGEEKKPTRASTPRLAVWLYPTMATRKPMFAMMKTTITRAPPIRASAPTPRLIWAITRIVSLPVEYDGVLDAANPPDIKRRLFPDAVPPVGPSAQRTDQPWHWYAGDAHAPCTCARTALSNELITNRAMNA